jgi:hypothetical protein
MRHGIFLPVPPACGAANGGCDAARLTLGKIGDCPQAGKVKIILLLYYNIYMASSAIALDDAAPAPAWRDRGQAAAFDANDE